MYNSEDNILPSLWAIITNKEMQEERQLPLHLYSEEALEYILEKLHETEQKYTELDVTRD